MQELEVFRCCWRRPGQRVLVEAGSMLVVGNGTLRVCFPFARLRERLVAVGRPGCRGGVLPGSGGWIELLALGLQRC